MPVYFPTPPHVARSGVLSWLLFCPSRNDSSRCLFIFPCHMSCVLVACLGCKCVVPGTTAADGCLFSHATSCRAFWWLVLAANVPFPERQLQICVYSCCPCALPVLSLCSPCALPVLSLRSPCALPVLSLCFPCALPVLSLCSPWALPD